MRAVMLLSSLSLAIFWCTTTMAAPVFELNPAEVDARLPSAVDTVTPNMDLNNPDNAMQARIGSHQTPSSLVPHAVFNNPGRHHQSRLGANSVSVAYLPNVNDSPEPGPAISSPVSSDDMLFDLLKDFKASPQKNPGRWTLLLMGLCFVLVQVRRRPMRASIKMVSTSQPI